MSEFDLREVLSGRSRAKAVIKIQLDERIDFELADLYERSGEDGVDDLIVAKEKERDNTSYTIHLRDVSNRSREDIQSKALHAFPFKRDLYGRDDPEQELNRRRLLTRLIFAAYISKIVSPSGAEQIVDAENGPDIVAAIMDEAPQSAIATLDAAIGKLSNGAAQKTSEEINVDFS